MRALGQAGLPVPVAVDHNRHAVLMSLVDATPLVQVLAVNHGLLDNSACKLRSGQNPCWNPMSFSAHVTLPSPRSDRLTQRPKETCLPAAGSEAAPRSAHRADHVLSRRADCHP